MAKSVPEKMTINPNAKRVFEAFGISGKRNFEIEAEISRILQSTNSIPEMVDKVLEKFDGRDLVYALVDLGFVLGRSSAFAEVAQALKKGGK